MLCYLADIRQYLAMTFLAAINLERGMEEVATGIWIESRVVAKHPTIQREAPTTKIYLAQNVNSSEVMWYKA